MRPKGQSVLKRSVGERMALLCHRTQGAVPSSSARRCSHVASARFDIKDSAFSVVGIKIRITWTPIRVSQLSQTPQTGTATRAIHPSWEPCRAFAKPSVDILKSSGAMLKLRGRPPARASGSDVAGHRARARSAVRSSSVGRCSVAKPIIACGPIGARGTSRMMPPRMPEDDD